MLAGTIHGSVAMIIIMTVLVSRKRERYTSIKCHKFNNFDGTNSHTRCLCRILSRGEMSTFGC